MDSGCCPRNPHPSGALRASKMAVPTAILSNPRIQPDSNGLEDRKGAFVARRAANFTDGLCSAFRSGSDVGEIVARA